MELLGFESNFENKGNQMTRERRDVFQVRHEDVLLATVVCVRGGKPLTRSLIHSFVQSMNIDRTPTMYHTQPQVLKPEQCVRLQALLQRLEPSGVHNKRMEKRHSRESPGPCGNTCGTPR